MEYINKQVTDNFEYCIYILQLLQKIKEIYILQNSKYQDNFNIFLGNNKMSRYADIPLRYSIAS